MLVALAAATALCAAMAATASANRFSYSSNQFRLTTPEWTIEIGTGTRGVCPITLEGSLHRSTFTKSFGTLLGYVTRASVGTCTNGRLTMLEATLPWHVRYEGFAGALPNIGTVVLRLAGLAFQVRVFEAFDCLYVATNPARWFLTREAGGAITSVRWAENIPLTRTSGFCGPEASVGGSGSLTQSGTETPISLTLV